MQVSISALIITKNNEDTIAQTLLSLKGLTKDIVIVDSCSTDRTVEEIRKADFNLRICRVFIKFFDDIGKQRIFGLTKIKSDWVLILDSDEVVSDNLKKEIKLIIKKSNSEITSYIIPFQNHFLGRPLRYGGENYKMQRLFKKDSLIIKPSVLHNNFISKSGETGKLKGKIFHYSYRSILQMYKKFTDYAKNDAEIKRAKGEKTSFKKIFMYPIHMFYARFIKDRGYKDGLFRIPLDLGFAYMEFLTYLLLI